MGTQALTISQNKADIIKIVNNDKFKSQLAAALMKRVPEEYVMRSAIATINGNINIQECTPLSVAGSILLLAQAGLAPEPWKGHGWLIPRNQKIKENGKPDRWIKVCTALIGYRGYLALAYRSSMVSKAGAACVFEGDIFDLDLGAGTAPVHKPWVKPEPGREKRGELIGSYSFAKLKSGEFIVEWMTKDDIEAVRIRSKAKDDGPWVTDYNEMARKTSFRRLFKWIPDDELQKIAAMEEAVEIGKTATVIDGDTGEIITVMQEDDGFNQETVSDQRTAAGFTKAADNIKAKLEAAKQAEAAGNGAEQQQTGTLTQKMAEDAGQTATTETAKPAEDAAKQATETKASDNRTHEGGKEFQYEGKIVSVSKPMEVKVKGKPKPGAAKQHYVTVELQDFDEKVYCFDKKVVELLQAHVGDPVGIWLLRTGQKNLVNTTGFFYIKDTEFDHTVPVVRVDRGEQAPEKEEATEEAEEVEQDEQQVTEEDFAALGVPGLFDDGKKKDDEKW